MSDQPAVSTPDAPATPPARPAQPAYGEYAPEGWEWKPEGSAAAPTAGSQDASARPAGVPHNLGAAGSGSTQSSSPQAAAQSTQQSAGAPYRAAAPAQPQSPQQLPPGYRPAGAAAPRIGDRVVTIVLLAFGAFGALNIAASFFGLESQLRLTGAMIGLEDTSVAAWVGPLGIGSALVVLLLFALTAIFSIQRMRANKLTFWVPLVAGVVAFILLVIVPMIALSGAPEIMTQLQNDPTGSLDKMLNALTEMQTP